MKARLTYKKPAEEEVKIEVTGSKSESNRLLILQAFYNNISLTNISKSDDTQVLQEALASVDDNLDIHHAGTAMRFLTAFFAVQQNREVLLTGSERMQQRPIGILVDALRDLGAEIFYEKNEGFPPLRIKGKKLKKNTVNIQANVSSQYISALMLIAPSLENGLELKLQGLITSTPYLNMTLSLLEKIGVETYCEKNKIKILPKKKVERTEVTVESDWSSASYFYSIVALSENLSVTLTSYSENSLQGDSELSLIYKNLGVETFFNSEENSITLSKNKEPLPEMLMLDLTNTPDIAQTIAVTCFGLNIGCDIKGLHTLKIKETDRLVALKNELGKFGSKIKITEDSLHLSALKNVGFANVSSKVIVVETYQDHRMAMAFAPLAIKTPFFVSEPTVVSKSFPTFWEDLQKAGIFSEIK